MVAVDDVRRRREHGEVVNDRHSRLTQFSSCFANSRAVDDGHMSARLKRKSKIADIKLRACPADQHAICYEDTQSAHQTFVDIRSKDHPRAVTREASSRWTPVQPVPPDRISG